MATMADADQPKGQRLYSRRLGCRTDSPALDSHDPRMIALVRLLARHAARCAYADFLKESGEGS